LIIKKIPRPLLNQKVHYRVHKSRPLCTIVIQSDLVLTLIPCFLSFKLNVILSPASESPMGSLSFKFSIKRFFAFLYSSSSIFLLFFFRTSFPSISYLHFLSLIIYYSIFQYFLYILSNASFYSSFSFFLSNYYFSYSTLLRPFRLYFCSYPGNRLF
jgi:hypothetical protein